MVHFILQGQVSRKWSEPKGLGFRSPQKQFQANIVGSCRYPSIHIYRRNIATFSSLPIPTSIPFAIPPRSRPILWLLIDINFLFFFPRPDCICWALSPFFFFLFFGGKRQLPPTLTRFPTVSSLGSSMAGEERLSLSLDLLMAPTSVQTSIIQLPLWDLSKKRYLHNGLKVANPFYPFNPLLHGS